MKTKNLLQSTILLIALCSITQFANAQGCNNNHPCKPGLFCWCFYGQNGRTHCRCEEPWYRVGQFVTTGYETFLTDIYPNPVSNSTTIYFSLSQSQKVSLKIVDMNGRLVSTLVDKIVEEGEHEIIWNADAVNAGIYFLQFQSADYLQTEKLVVTK